MNIRFLLALPFLINAQPSQLTAQENRIPFYEDYFAKSDVNGYLREAVRFLEEKPDAVEAPRLAMDYFMAAKVARNPEAVNRAIGFLLFRYPGSLPTLHYLSSFEKGSSKLIEVLKTQADIADLQSKDFAVSYCRTLLLIARAQNPELLRDKSLRLRAYLLASKAGVKEIEKIALESLTKDTEKDGELNKVIQVVVSNQTVTEKIAALGKLGGNETIFCIKFYLGQLTEEEKKAPAVLALQLKQSLFQKNGSIEGAFTTFSSLPENLSKLAKYQTFLAIAQHFDERDEDAIKTLKKISTKSFNKEMAAWGKTARDYAEGLESSSNRKKLFLEAFGKSFDLLSKEADCLLIEGQHTNTSESGDASNYRAYIALSSSRKSFEIQLLSNDQLQFAFRTDHEKASIITPGAKEQISFQSPGALPIPRFDIVRDISTGGFNYNFNLSFASSYPKLADEGDRLLKNPYLSTNKGREVLLNYLLSSKPLWLGPAKSIQGGTAFPLFAIDPDSPTPTSAGFSFDLSGNLISCKFGQTTLSKISRGDDKVLEGLPVWPKLPVRTEEKFDFALIMKIVSEISKNFAQK